MIGMGVVSYGCPPHCDGTPTELIIQDPWIRPALPGLPTFHVQPSPPQEHSVTVLKPHARTVTIAGMLAYFGSKGGAWKCTAGNVYGDGLFTFVHSSDYAVYFSNKSLSREVICRIALCEGREPHVVLDDIAMASEACK